MDNLASFTDILDDEIENSQPISLPSSISSLEPPIAITAKTYKVNRPNKGAGQYGEFRSVEEIDSKYRSVFSHSFFNMVQSKVIDDALYSDKSMVICAPTGSGKTVIFEMAIVQLLMSLDDKNYTGDFKIVYMAPVKALCSERLSEWYPKFTKLGLMCIEVTGDTDVDFSQLKPYRIIITTPEKWDMLTRRWRDHKALVEVIKLFLIDEVHILNEETRGPVLEAVVSRMKTIESSVQSNHRIEQLQKQYQGILEVTEDPPRIRFVAVSATVSNPEDVASWLGTTERPAKFYKFGDECRPVKLKRVVEGYPCAEGTSIFKFDIILNYKLWPIIQKYHNGKPTLIFCNTRKGVVLTAETLSKELTINFNPEQKAKLVALASTTKNKKLQALILSGVGCHHAGLLFEERLNIEQAFRNRDLPILITTTTLAMGVNLPAHLVIIKNTQQYVNGAYQEYSISTVLQMVGRAGRPQFDTEATAVIMTRLADKHRYESLVGGNEPLQSFLHKRLAENLNSEAALGTVGDVAQCVQWLRSTFLFVRAARDPRRYLSLPSSAPQSQISKKIEELCVKAMNGLATAGLITMDEASCIESTDAGRLMSIYYLDVETMKNIMKIDGTETLERLLAIICESHEMSDMHLRVDERRCLNALNRNNAAATIRFPMKGKISTRQMKLNCIIQAILGCLPITDPSLNQEAMKVMRVAERICKCLVAYVTRPDLISQQPQYFSAVMNSIVLAKCVTAHLWENSPFVSKQLKGIGPTFSALLATAGKVNFMLLEESHPRDLERIMNKGPPAGNALRKQISLLPKYHLDFTPVNEKTITLQLVLQNASFLSENLEHLTASESHKSYIIVGDSDNCLLLLTSIKDKDLISFYGGSITYEITRKRNCEHKIFAHCISSNFVGIDAQCEFLFKDLEPPTYFTMDTTNKKMQQRQTCITDVYKQRKRKNVSIDNTPQPAKKQRENYVVQKFNELKAPFNATFDMLNKNINSTKTSTNINNCDMLHKLSTDNDNNLTKSAGITFTSNLSENDIIDLSEPEINTEKIDEYIDDEQINNLLNNIEKEISKDCKTQFVRGKLSNQTTATKSIGKCLFKDDHSNNASTSFNIDKFDKNLLMSEISNDLEKRNDIRTRPIKTKNTKRNYNFIESLEKNDKFNDDEGNIDSTNKVTGFSTAIKNNIDKYLKTIEHGSMNSNVVIDLVSDKDIDKLPNVKLAPECINSLQLRGNTPKSDIDSRKNDHAHNQYKCNTEITTEIENTCTMNERNGFNNISIINSPQLEETKSDIICTTKDLKSDTPIINATHNSSMTIMHNGGSKIDTRLEGDTISPQTNVYVMNRSVNLKVNDIQSIDDTKTIHKEYQYNEKVVLSDSISVNNYAPFLNSDTKRLEGSILKMDNYACVTEVISMHSVTTNNANFKSSLNNLVKVIRKLNVNVTKTISTKAILTKLYSVPAKIDELDKSSKIDIKSDAVNKANQSIIDMKCNDIAHYEESHDIDKSKSLNKIDIFPKKINMHEDGLINTIDNLEDSNFAAKIRMCHTDESTLKKELSIYNNLKNNSNYIDETDMKEVKNTTNCFGFKESKIADILQKYSCSLRQKHVNLDRFKSFDTHHKKNSGQQAKSLKKPFQIKDIENLQITLPEIFVCNTSNNLAQSMNQSTEPEFPTTESKTIDDEVICKDLQFSNQSESYDMKAVSNNGNQLKCFPVIDYFQEPSFNINYSMLDPKALLQCLEKDDEIIPPPPQFRDNFLSEEVDSPQTSKVISPEINEISHYSLSDYNDLELMYGNSCSLSSQSSFHDSRLDFNVTQDCTTLNSNQPEPNLLKSCLLSRRYKLEQFKFPMKKKMKM